MTAQAHDLVRWKSTDHLLVGVDGTGLFEPRDHGLETRPTTTANWRGWVALYGIEEERLTLLELHDVGLPGEMWDAPPRLFGVEAATESRGSFRYPALNHPVAFTGRLIVAHGFIQEHYRHMGFHPAWKFERSWECSFDEGRLTGARDLSGEMRELRRKIETGAADDPDDTNEPNWIVRTFGLDFWRSKGR